MQDFPSTVIALVGPTAVGKSTLEKHLVNQGCSRMVSFTTREPRAGEVDGADYHFVSFGHLEEMELSGSLIEQVEYAGNVYGLSEECVWAALNKKEAPAAVVVCDPHGLAQLRKYLQLRSIKVFGVYLHQPLELLFERILERLARDVANGKVGMEGYYAKRILTMISDFPTWPYMGKYDLRLGPEELQSPPQELAEMVLRAATVTD